MFNKKANEHVAVKKEAPNAYLKYRSSAPGCNNVCIVCDIATDNGLFYLVPYRKVTKEENSDTVRLGSEDGIRVAFDLVYENVSLFSDLHPYRYGKDGLPEMDRTLDNIFNEFSVSISDTDRTIFWKRHARRLVYEDYFKEDDPRL